MPRQNHYDFHLWHASDFWKSTAAMNTSNHSPRMQSSNDCSTSSLNPSNPEICASPRYECVWVTLDSTHLLDSKSNIQSLCVLVGFQDLARNPHVTCTQTDWTLWHENFDHLLGSANVAPGRRYKLIYTKMNISGYRPWQYHTQTLKYHTQTLKGESVARKTCKDQ